MGEGCGVHRPIGWKRKCPDCSISRAVEGTEEGGKLPLPHDCCVLDLPTRLLGGGYRGKRTRDCGGNDHDPITWSHNLPGTASLLFFFDGCLPSCDIRMNSVALEMRWGSAHCMCGLSATPAAASYANAASCNSFCCSRIQIAMPFTNVAKSQFNS